MNNIYKLIFIKGMKKMWYKKITKYLIIICIFLLVNTCTNEILVQAATENDYDVKVTYWSFKEKKYIGEPQYYKFSELEKSSYTDMLIALSCAKNKELVSCAVREEYNNTNSTVYIVYPEKSPNGYYVSGLAEKTNALQEKPELSFAVNKVGWIKFRDQWEYLYSNGEFARGWSKIGDKWYYFDKETADMVCDQYIDGYYLGSDGVCIL